MRRRSARVAQQQVQRLRQRAGSFGGTSRPLRPGIMVSGTPPTCVPITGSPIAAASTNTVPKASRRVGSANTSKARNAVPTSLRRPAKWMRRASACPSARALAQLLRQRHAIAHQHQMRVGMAARHPAEGLDQILMPFSARITATQPTTLASGGNRQLAAQAGARPVRRQGHRRMDHLDRLGPRAAFQQLAAHIAADGDHAVRQPGIGVQRVDRLGQVARAHDQRRAGQPRADGRQHGVAPAVRVQHIEAPAAQHPSQRRHAAQEIHRPVHQRVVDLKPASRSRPPSSAWGWHTASR